MTIHPLYDEAPIFPPLPEERYAVASQKPTAYRHFTSRGAFLLGFAATWIWWVACLVMVVCSTALWLLSLGQIGGGWWRRTWRRFTFSATCSLGCFVALFSVSIGVSFLCLAILWQGESQGSSSLIEFLRTHIQGNI